ncbi:hypothetical protein Tco_1214498 [Tanacetum coccineum]
MKQGCSIQIEQFITLAALSTGPSVKDLTVHDNWAMWTRRTSWFVSVKPNAPHGGLDRGGDDVGSVWQRGKRVCGGGEDDDMVLMIDSAVMWMMVESGVARLEWPEGSPDNGRRRREML